MVPGTSGRASDISAVPAVARRMGAVEDAAHRRVFGRPGVGVRRHRGTCPVGKGLPAGRCAVQPIRPARRASRDGLPRLAARLWNARRVLELLGHGL
ncbi:MAG: hypothetical protein ACLUPV_01570 [Bilophila wadsworthia]